MRALFVSVMLESGEEIVKSVAIQLARRYQADHPRPFPDSLEISVEEAIRLWPRGKLVLPADWGDLSPDSDAEKTRMEGREMEIHSPEPRLPNWGTGQGHSELW